MEAGIAIGVLGTLAAEFMALLVWALLAVGRRHR